ncbi:hypothetical protein V1477_018558 [Vespula maculifrons]|uniref:Uncharacterized protein n=1 Tax=Vespula maculifrons TaxID=7453 RepID=A0ABD2AVQ3_VESMC
MENEVNSTPLMRHETLGCFTSKNRANDCAILIDRDATKKGKRENKGKRKLEVTEQILSISRKCNETLKLMQHGPLKVLKILKKPGSRTDVMSGMLVSVGGLGKAEDRFRAQCGSMPGKLAAALSVTPVSPTQGAKSTRLAITRAFRNFAAVAAAFASAAAAGAGAGAAAAVATTAAAATAAARVFAVHSKPVPNELAKKEQEVAQSRKICGKMNYERSLVLTP